MNKNIALALFAGLFGGMLSHYISPTVAFAQNQIQIPKEIRAQGFTLVDQSNQPVGTFIAEGVRIVLRDSKGREIWSAGGSGLQPLSNLR